MRTTTGSTQAAASPAETASDPRVANVFAATVRDAFPPLDPAQREMSDTALIYLVEALHVPSDARVLIVEPYSGYLPTVIAHLAREVTVLCAQPERASKLRAQLEHAGPVDINIETFVGDRGDGEAGYDRIVVLQPAHEELGPVLQGLLTANGRALWSADRASPPRRMRRLVRSEHGDPTEEDLDLEAFMPMLGRLLVEAGAALQQDVAAAVLAAAEHGCRLGEELLRRGAVREEDLYRVLAEQHGMPFVRAADVLAQLDVVVARSLPRALLEHHQLLPIAEVGGRMFVATTDVALPAWELVPVFDGMDVVPHLIPPSDLRMVWTAIELGLVALAAKAREAGEDLRTPATLQRAARAASLFEAILVDAVATRTRALHLERHPDGSRLRFRIDGCLGDVAQFQLTSSDVGALVRYIAASTGLDLHDHRRAQGGRMRQRVGERTFDLQVQFQPTAHGDSMVVQLRPQQEPPSFVQLGFAPGFAAELGELLRRPEGLVLFVGGAGAGVTSTLYAGLREIAPDAARKVVTIEDPITAPLHGALQCEVDLRSGFDVAVAVRSLAQQDPDVLMVGALRDLDTAREALRVVRDGRLVLLRMHGRDAADAMQRLGDLGVAPGELANTLTAVVAQRLARRICPDCRTAATPAAAALAELFPAGAPDGFECFVGAGCATCAHTGVRGQVPLVELVTVDADLRAAIRQRSSADELRAWLRHCEAPSLRTDALRLVREGVVGLDEVRRVLAADLLRPGD